MSEGTGERNGMLPVMDEGEPGGWGGRNVFETKRIFSPEGGKLYQQPHCLMIKKKK